MVKQRQVREKKLDVEREVEGTAIDEREMDEGTGRGMWNRHNPTTTAMKGRRSQAIPHQI